MDDGPYREVARGDEIFGDYFIARCFTSVYDVTDALSRSMETLIHHEEVMERLGPAIAGPIRIDAFENSARAARRVVRELSQSSRIPLQRAVLRFIKKHRWLDYCLKDPSEVRKEHVRSSSVGPPTSRSIDRGPTVDAYLDAIPIPVLERARAHHTEACRLRDRSALAEAASRFDEEVAIRGVLNQPDEALYAQAMALQTRGQLAWTEDRFEDAMALFEQCKALFAGLELGIDEAKISQVWELRCKVLLAFDSQEHERALNLLGEAKVKANTVKDCKSQYFHIADLFAVESKVLTALGKHVEAAWSTATSLQKRGHFALYSRDYAQAESYFKNAEQSFRQLADGDLRADISYNWSVECQAEAAFQRRDFHEACHYFEEERELWLQCGGHAERVGFADAQLHMAKGWVFWRRGERDSARQLWEAESRIWESIRQVDRAQSARNRMRVSVRRS